MGVQLDIGVNMNMIPIITVSIMRTQRGIGVNVIMIPIIT